MCIYDAIGANLCREALPVVTHQNERTCSLAQGGEGDVTSDAQRQSEQEGHVLRDVAK